MAVVPVPVTSRDCVSPFAVKLTLVLAAAVNGGARRRPNSPAATFGEPATSPTPRTENFTDSVTSRTPIIGECQLLSLEPADIGGGANEAAATERAMLRSPLFHGGHHVRAG